MYIRPLTLLGVAVALSGCFSSGVEIWPEKSGERLPVPEGNYTCTSYENGVPWVATYAVKSQSEGMNLYYVVSSEVEPPATMSFHKIEEGLYLLSTDDGDGDYLLAYIRVIGSRIIGLIPRPEQTQEFAKKHNISLTGGSYLSGGETIEALRGYVIDLGKHLTDSNIDSDCSPSP